MKIQSMSYEWKEGMLESIISVLFILDVGRNFYNLPRADFENFSAFHSAKESTTFVEIFPWAFLVTNDNCLQ